jgi:hypothetical protein
MTITLDGSQHRCPVGKEESIADIEENDAPVSHTSILLKTPGFTEDVALQSIAGSGY